MKTTIFTLAFMLLGVCQAQEVYTTNNNGKVFLNQEKIDSEKVRVLMANNTEALKLYNAGLMKTIFLLLLFLSLNFYLNNLFYKYISNKKYTTINNQDNKINILKKVYLNNFISSGYIFVFFVIFLLTNIIFNSFFNIRELNFFHTQYLILSFAIIFHFMGKIFKLTDSHKNYDISKEKYKDLAEATLKVTSCFLSFFTIILPFLMVLYQLYLLGSPIRV
jgi:hypothetical protein